MLQQRTPPLVAASALLLGFLVLSGLKPYDRLTWALEVAPVFIALPILWGTYRRFPLTTLLYVCLVAHALALMLGGAHEFIEWGAALVAGPGAVEFLGSHGDPRDTQSDMLFALIGAVTALSLFARIQDRQIQRLQVRETS